MVAKYKLEKLQEIGIVQSLFLIAENHKKSYDKNMNMLNYYRKLPK